MVGLTNRVGTPCKDCRSRHPKCHGQCEEYAAYSEIDFYSMNNARRERAKMVIKRKREGR
jgi:predicted ATP-dependent serine protease